MPRWPDRTPEERFWSNVDKSGECWVWTRGRDKYGYGNIKVDGKRIGTHRFAYTLAYGPIPEGLSVCHRCDNPPCVRPDHLFAVTEKDNAQDREQKGRSHFQKHPELVKCGEDHHAAKLTDEQVRFMRLIREKLGLSYEKLAVVFDVSTSTVHRVCNGTWWKHVG